MKAKTATKTPKPVRSSELVRRAAARTLLRLKRETVLRPIGPICMEEWQCCRDIIAEEITKLLPNDKGEPQPPTASVADRKTL